MNEPDTLASRLLEEIAAGVKNPRALELEGAGDVLEGLILSGLVCAHPSRGLVLTHQGRRVLGQRRERATVREDLGEPLRPGDREHLAAHSVRPGAPGVLVALLLVGLIAGAAFGLWRLVAWALP